MGFQVVVIFIDSGCSSGSNSGMGWVSKLL